MGRNNNEINYDDDCFYPEHHMANRIEEILHDERYEGLSAMTIVGVLTTIAGYISAEGYTQNKEPDEGEDWKG